MSTRFSKLPKTTFSGLEYQNIIEDIIALVKENPDYSEQYDDFLSSNAGRMLIELFAYITDQLSTRIDYVVNENFISTASQKSSVIKLLKLIGYAFQLPAAAKVEVTVEDVPEEAVGKYFTQSFELYGDFVYPFSLVAEDKNGELRNFELVDPNDYDHIFKIENKTYLFYEGTTRVEDFYVETDNNQVFTLSHPSVIKDSVKVYRVIEGVSATEFGRVNSFLEPQAQFSASKKFEKEITEGEVETYPLPYKLNVEENNIVTIEFPPSDIVKNVERRPNVNDQIRVIYRTGGGDNGNIVPRAIKVERKIPVYNEDGSLFNPLVQMKFTNYSYGYEGENEENVETATIKAPIEIQTAKKTVTEEDYDAILGSFDEVLLSKSIGNSNPIAYSEKLYSKYGKYINPLEVWNFILTNKKNWENVDPEEYNDFSWLELRLENRFNEPTYFLNGEDNLKYEVKPQDLNRVNIRELTATSNSDANKIVCSSGSFTNSYLGYYVKVAESQEEDNLDEERVVIGVNSTTLTLNIPLPKATKSGDKYVISDPYSYVIETPALFKDNTTTDNFGVKITKGKALSSYFSQISYNLDINGSITKTTPQSISEDVYPYFVSNRNINNMILLDGDLILNIGGTQKTITFASAAYSIEDIVNAINSNFSNLSAMTDDFYVQGDIEKNSTRIKNISYNMERIRKGMEISFGGFTSTVEEIYIKDRSIVIKDAPTSSSEKQRLLRIKDITTTVVNKVASVDVSTEGKFIVLRASAKGANAYIKIDGELSVEIFGTGAPTYIKGTKTLFVNDDKNLVYRKNSTEREDIFIHYTASFSNEVQIGKEVTGEKEIFNKPKAERVHSTNYNKISKKIDYYNSNFTIRFTKEKVATPSLHSIADDWTLVPNTFPEIESKAITFPLANNIKLNLNIDGNIFSIENVGGSTLAELCENIDSLIMGKNLEFYHDYSGFKYAIPSGTNKLILRSPTNFSNSKISATEVGSTYLFNSATTDTPVGDYYIKVNSDDDIMLYKTSSSSLPDFKFYSHFVSDNRYVPDIYDGQGGRKGTKIGDLNEDKIKEKLDIYKITGVENAFKQPSFKVFDLVGTIVYSRAFSVASIEREVKDVLLRTFSLNNSVIGASIAKSKIISLVHNIPGVLYFTIDYFGLDRNNPETNQANMIEADFDEIIVIGTSDTKGLKLSYKSE